MACFSRCCRCLKRNFIHIKKSTQNGAPQSSLLNHVIWHFSTTPSHRREQKHVACFSTVWHRQVTTRATCLWTERDVKIVFTEKIHHRRYGFFSPWQYWHVYLKFSCIYNSSLIKKKIGWKLGNWQIYMQNSFHISPSNRWAFRSSSSGWSWLPIVNRIIASSTGFKGVYVSLISLVWCGSACAS